MKIIAFLSCLAVMTLPFGGAFAQGVTKSDLNDQVGMKVTVYNNNLGLIKDTRKVALPPGEGELRFMDVASQIMPPTVHAASLNHPEGFSVLEQNYEYDLMNAKKLLDKYVGRDIKIVDWNRYQDRKEVVEATLLSNNQDQIYRINDEIYLGHPGYKVLPGLPENLIAKPTLTWIFANHAKGSHELEVSYLTTGINWRADYVMVLNRTDTSADLSGWVTVDNRSGATYKDARLKLVAGEVHRVAEDRAREVPQAAAFKAARAPQFEEKAFFEYHIYDLGRKTTIKDNQTKQISLLEARNAGVQKELLVYGVKSYFTRKFMERTPKQPVNVYMRFKNSKENHLGMPLPAGVVRLYKQDEDASQQFVGEDRIDHVPKDEEVKLKIGEAFDVVAERVQTDYRQLTSRLHESEWEITLRNHKELDVKVGIVEPLFGNWKIVSNSHPYKKEDAFTIRFDVGVPKNGEVKVKYGVQVGL
ncbi:MAG: DUF4139 domain-containing protein [Deltaproteobacteria bacterium]|nr:DUF4139 domain-containing protein [Deltaproteobacteria bacterium]